MKKINKKGFTLIELLAVVIIMGVLLLVAIPAVTKTIERSRIRTYKSNLSKFVDAVTIEVNSYDNTNYQFGSNEYLVVPFVCIDLERGSNSKSPFANYVPLRSYIVVERDTAKGYTYKVAALDDAGYGTTLGTATDADVKLTAEDDITAITKNATTNKHELALGIADKTAKVVECTAIDG